MMRPLCRYCGKPIPKRTTTLRFVDELKSHMTNDQFTIYVVGTPQTKAEAQRLTNLEVVSVQRGCNPWGKDSQLEYITSVGVWDGERYADPYFCNGQHAKDFAYMIAKARPTLGSETWASAIERQRAKESK